MRANVSAASPHCSRNQPEVTRHDTPCTAAARPVPRLRGGHRPRQYGAQLQDDPGPGRMPARAAVTTPAGQEADGPNVARVYDHLLGGSHNFDADRVAAAEFLARWPDARRTMAANREFLGRAVRHLAGQAGIRQFLDIGSGIPTMGNVHAIAQQAAPDARVVYADIDEVAVLHSRAILGGNDKVIAIQADLRNPQAILEHPGLRGLLDLSRPAALLLVAVLHFLPDGPVDPVAVVARLRDALAPGSYVVISHGTTDGQPAHVAEAMEHYARTTADFQPRGHAGILRFFDGLDMIEPGLVHLPAWRPDDPSDAEHAERIAAYGGAGRKP
jgi:SAM-dependent methyltransferase